MVKKYILDTKEPWKIEKVEEYNIQSIEKYYQFLKESGYKIAFDMEENWYRQEDKLLGNKEFLVQDPDGYLLRFSEDLGVKSVE